MQHRFYEFGSYRLDTARLTLWREGTLVDLNPKAIDTLRALVQRAGTPVSKQDLLREVWPDVNVEEDNVRKQIEFVREELGKDPTCRDCIQTIRARGYMFRGDLVRMTIADFPAAGESLSHPPSQALQTPHKGLFRRVPLWSIGVVAALAVAIAIFLVVLRNRPRRVIEVNQLTADGYPKDGPLSSDGKVVWFEEEIEGVARLASVPVTGGAVTRIQPPGLASVILLDIRYPGPDYLLSGVDETGQNYLWDWVPGRMPTRLLAGNAGSGAWIRDLLLADNANDQLRLIDRGAVSRVISLPGSIRDVRWSGSRGIMRFSVYDPMGHPSLWEMKGLAGVPERIAAYPPESLGGSWSGDGSVFAFSVHGKTGFDIWAAHDSEPARPSFPAQPFRITAGPLNYSSPLPSPDGRSVLAIGVSARGELVQFAPSENRFTRYLDGLNAAQLDFSRDGQWVTYVRLPDRTLWKARVNGRDMIQLTSPPLAAHEPHWSPDGSQIAFMGERPGTVYRIYLISAQGGQPREGTADGAEQGVPTWSADGSSIVFGDLLRGKPQEMSVHILDLKRHTVSKLPGSQGIWTPRWSPDGAFIAALTPDFKRLKLHDCRRKTWRELTFMDNIDHLHWTADSEYLHFRGLASEGFPEVRAKRALYRVQVQTGKLERVVDLDGFTLPAFEWFGITPDGSPLGLHGVSIQELYSINLQ